MKIRSTLMAAGILAAAMAISLTASAQGQGNRDRTRGPGQPARTEMDRAQDRDRMMDRDRVRQQDRDRIYASELMTEQERTQYMSQLRTLRTEKERMKFRLEHQQAMQQRAKQQGAKLGTAPTQRQLAAQERERQRERTEIFGYELMEQGELDRYREQLRAAQTTQERERIQAEHKRLMQERARERDAALATDSD